MTVDWRSGGKQHLTLLTSHVVVVLICPPRMQCVVVAGFYNTVARARARAKAWAIAAGSRARERERGRVKSRAVVRSRANVIASATVQQLWFGLVWSGLVWSGLVCSCLVWSGLAWLYMTQVLADYHGLQPLAQFRAISVLTWTWTWTWTELSNLYKAGSETLPDCQVVIGQ